LLKRLNKMLIVIISIVLKPGSVRRVDTRPDRFGVGIVPGLRKNRIRKNPV